MRGPRAPTRRRSPQEELTSRIRKLVGRAAKSLRWKENERARWEGRVAAGFEPGSPPVRRLSEHLFRLAGRLTGPAAASEAPVAVVSFSQEPASGRSGRVEPRGTLLVATAGGGELEGLGGLFGVNDQEQPMF